MAVSVTPRALRSDAARNQGRILDAAHAEFSEHGLDAAVEDIARRAGVGIGTLYRRFPTKDALLAAIVEERFAELVGVAEEALTAADPWDGFERFVVAVAEMQAADHGFKDLVVTRLDDEGTLAQVREKLDPLAKALLERAQRAGRVRADVGVGDLATLLWGVGRIVEVTGDVAPEAWRRTLALNLSGWRAGAPGRLPGEPLSDAQRDGAMRCAGRPLR